MASPVAILEPMRNPYGTRPLLLPVIWKTFRGTYGHSGNSRFGIRSGHQITRPGNHNSPLQVEEMPPPTLALPSSSSSPDKAVTSMGLPLPLDNFRAHEKLLNRGDSNLGLEAAEIKERTDKFLQCASSCSTSLGHATSTQKGCSRWLRPCGKHHLHCHQHRRGLKRNIMSRPRDLSISSHTHAQGP